MSKLRPFFRPTSPKNCTVQFTLPVEIVRKLQRLAVRGRRSERDLCQDVLRAFTNTVFTGASFQQFHTLVNAKVTKPAFVTLRDKRTSSPWKSPSTTGRKATGPCRAAWPRRAHW